MYLEDDMEHRGPKPWYQSFNEASKQQVFAIGLKFTDLKYLFLGNLVLLKQNKLNHVNVFFTFGSGSFSVGSLSESGLQSIESGHHHTK